VKVTKLKRGYVIRLSDSEFGALEYLVQLGQTDLEGEDLSWHPLTPAVKRAINGRFMERAAMAVDDDRRGR
jgi:hypothetical protein